MNKTAIEKVGSEMDMVGAFSSVGGYELAQRVAKGLAQSSLVPEAYKNNIPNVLLAMEIANRTGSSIFAVMQNLFIVYGKPGFSSTYLIGTVNSCGRFTPLRYRWEGERNSDDWGCRAYAEDKESGEECTGPLVNIKMAKDDGWYNRKDKKGNFCSKWRTLPEIMLMYRAAAFWSRVFAPELSLGMQSIEEVHDVSEPVYVQTVEVQKSPTQTMADELKARTPKKREKVSASAPALGRVQELIAEAEAEFGVNGSEWISHQCKQMKIKRLEMTDDQANQLLAELRKGG